MLEQAKLVSIIREVQADNVLPVMDALVEEGIRWFEISLSDGENGMECIRRAVEHFGGGFPDEKMYTNAVHVGAGTVTTKEQIDILAEWRIPYMLTPGFDSKIVQYALCKGIEVLPGVLTPSEVQQAANCGIRLMKLFPADAFGKGYIKALKGPFPDVDFVAVGGVTAENASEFYRAGFQGVAAGSNLVPRGAGMADIDRIRERARRYVRAAAGSVTAENNA